MPRHTPRPPRRAVAAVELAFIMPVLLIFVLGIWEVGRLIQVQQALNNAAREGARLAAQGLIINTSGTLTQVQVNSGTPSVQSTIDNYLKQAGYDTTGLSVSFAFVNGDTTQTQPYQGAKGQRFVVNVTLPFNNVKWTLLNVTGMQTLGASVTWESLVDDPFTLNTTLPSW